MSSRIFRGLAFAAGLGLVIGIVSAKRRHEGSSMDHQLPDDGPSAESLGQRLDRIELRISAIEARPPAVAELETRVEQQVQELRQQMDEHRQRIAGELAAIEKRFADVTKAIPGVLESIIVPRVEDLRAHLKAETQQSVNASLTRFERAIDDKVSERINNLERTLLDQSSIVTSLSQRAVETDMNIQRLISAVERLVDRPTSPLAPVRQEPSRLDLPFQKELKEALNRQQEIPPGFQSAFRPQIVKEEDDTNRRHRVPLTNL